MKNLFVACSICAALSVPLAGCSTEPIVQSERWPNAGASEVTAYYALPRAYFNLSITRKNCVVEINTDADKPVTYLPDPDRRYILKYKSSDWNTDTLSVEVDKNGLLKTVNATSEDKSADAIKSVLDIATDVTKKLLDLHTLAESKEQQPVCDPKKDLDIVYSFDPTDPKADLSGLKGMLPADLSIAITLPSASTGTPADCPSDKAAICFRPAALYDVSIVATEHLAGKMTPKAGKAGSKKVKDMDIIPPSTVTLTRKLRVVAPDPTRVFYVAMKRRGAAKLDVKLTFENGMLTKNDGTYASEALAVAQWPAQIVKSAIGLSDAASSATAPKK